LAGRKSFLLRSAVNLRLSDRNQANPISDHSLLPRKMKDIFFVSLPQAHLLAGNLLPGKEGKKISLRFILFLPWQGQFTLGRWQT